MTNFPTGQLVLREFPSITEAHVAASELSAKAAKDRLDFRLVEVSATAGGAWVCAWLSARESEANRHLAMSSGFEIFDVDESLMNAFLSLSPKPPAETELILILEAESIADVFRSAIAYSEIGATLIEIRVKRAGPMPGAYAYLAAPVQKHAAQTLAAVQALAKVTAVDLIGDYRRYFL